MTADESSPTPPIGDELGELWTNADTREVGGVDMLRRFCEKRERGELPVEEWETTVAGVMARGRWMRDQLDRASMGLPCDDFDLAPYLEDVRRDLDRLNTVE